MAVTTRLEIQNSVSETVTDLLRKLMTQGAVDALLVPQRLPTGDNVVQTLVRDPEKLGGVDPFAPVMAVTSLSGEDDRQKGVDAGIDEYQIKLDRDAVLRALEAILVRKKNVS